MRRVPPAAALVLGLGILATGTSPAQDTDPLLEVRGLLAEGDRPAARAQLDSLLAEMDSLDPRTQSEARFLGALLEEDGAQLEERLEVLLEPPVPALREAWIHLVLGQLAFWRGDLEVALAEFRQARAGGRDEEGALWEGLTAFALGDGDAARAALTRATASGQAALRQRAWVILGDTFRAGDDWVEAIAAYENVRRENPGGPGWWATATYRQAECYEKLGASKRATTLYEELLVRLPDSYEAAEAVARGRSGEGGSVREEELVPEGETGTVEGFAVQVGAFRLEENARGLEARVAAAGFGPVRVSEGEDNLFRVRVGNFPGREGAESLGDSLGIVLGLGYSIVPGRAAP